MLLDHVIISWVFCASYRRDRNLHQVTFRERKQILLLMLSRLLHFAKLCKNNFYPPFSVQISFAQKLGVSSKTEFCQKRSDIFGAADSNLIAHQTRFVPSLIKNWWTGRWSNLKWWLLEFTSRAPTYLSCHGILLWARERETRIVTAFPDDDWREYVISWSE